MPTELSSKAGWTWEVKGTGFSRADGVNVLKVDLEKEEEVERVLGDVRYVQSLSFGGEFGFRVFWNLVARDALWRSSLVGMLGQLSELRG